MPTATGDFVVVDIEVIGVMAMGTHIYSLESLDIHPDGQTSAKSNVTGT